MNVEQIRQRLHDDSSPFVIRLSDGRRFTIPHQDFIAPGKHAVVVINEAGYAVRSDPPRIVSLDDAGVENGRG